MEKAYDKRFDAVGIVTFHKNGRPIYGTGTLIHPRVVLTAAHVIENAPQICFVTTKKCPNSGKVTLGVKVLGQAVIHKYHTDGNKSKRSENDIALIFLDDEVYCEKYGTLCSNEITESKLCIYEIVGFGNYHFKQEIRPLETPSCWFDRKLYSKVLSFRQKLNLISYVYNTCNIDLFGTCKTGDSGRPLIKANNGLEICGIFSEPKSFFGSPWCPNKAE